MAYTQYRSTDSGAPVLNGTTGSLIALLDACLIDGYGSKDSAGWSKVYGGTNKAVYRPPAGSRRYLRVLDDGSDATNGARVARVRGYVDMSDVDTGDEPFPTDAQISGGMFICKSSTLDSTARHWVMLVDGKRFVLMIAYHASHLQSYSQNVFGDPGGVSAADLYEAILVAANSSTDAVSPNVGASVFGSSVVHGSSGVTVTGYTPRNRAGTGTSAPAYINRHGTASGNSTFTAGPDSAGNIWVESLMVREASATDANAPRGYIPGILFLLNYLELSGYPSFTEFGDMFLLRCGSNGGNAFIVDRSAGGDDV